MVLSQSRPWQCHHIQTRTGFSPLHEQGGFDRRTNASQTLLPLGTLERSVGVPGLVTQWFSRH